MKLNTLDIELEALSTSELENTDGGLLPIVIGAIIGAVISVLT